MTTRVISAIARVGAAALLAMGAASSVQAQWMPDKRLTTISYNIYQDKGYPETDDTRPIRIAMRPQMPQRLALELALYSPDIVTLQEAPPEDDVRALAALLDMNYVYFEGGFPGAVLTTFEILSSTNCPLASMDQPGDLFSRHWGKASLHTGEERIEVYSIHMHPSDETIRAREQDEVLRVLQDDLAQGKPVLLQGDFNHEPIQTEYTRWQEAGFVDCYQRKGVEQPYTIKSTVPNRTVDYVWVNRPLADRLLRCRVLYEGGFRTNPLDERSVALSDHLPVLAEFR